MSFFYTTIVSCISTIVNIALYFLELLDVGQHDTDDKLFFFIAVLTLEAKRICQTFQSKYLRAAINSMESFQATNQI